MGFPANTVCIHVLDCGRRLRIQQTTWTARRPRPGELDGISIFVSFNPVSLHPTCFTHVALSPAFILATEANYLFAENLGLPKVLSSSSAVDSERYTDTKD